MFSYTLVLTLPLFFLYFIPFLLLVNINLPSHHHHYHHHGENIINFQHLQNRKAHQLQQLRPTRVNLEPDHTIVRKITSS